MKCTSLMIVLGVGLLAICSHNEARSIVKRSWWSWDNIKDSISSTANKAVEGATDFGNTVIEGTQDLAEDFEEGVKKSVDEVKVFGDTVADGTQDLAEKTGEGIEQGLDKVKEFGDTVADGMQDLAEKTGEGIEQGLDKVKEFGDTVADGTQDLAEKTGEGLEKGLDKVKEFGDTVANGTQDLVEKAGEGLEKGLDKVKKFGNTVANSTQEFAQKAEESLKNGLDNVEEMVNEAIMEGLEGLGNLGGMFTTSTAAMLGELHKKIMRTRVQQGIVKVYRQLSSELHPKVGGRFRREIRSQEANNLQNENTTMTNNDTASSEEKESTVMTAQKKGENDMDVGERFEQAALDGVKAFVCHFYSSQLVNIITLYTPCSIMFICDAKDSVKEFVKAICHEIIRDAEWPSR